MRMSLVPSSMELRARRRDRPLLARPTTSLRLRAHAGAPALGVALSRSGLAVEGNDGRPSKGEHDV